MYNKTGRRSLVVRAAGTKSGGRGFESHIGHDGYFSATGSSPGCGPAVSTHIYRLHMHSTRTAYNEKMSPGWARQKYFF